MPPHIGGLRAGIGVRRHPQQLRLPAAHLSGLISTPVVTTIHGFSSPQIVPVYVKYNHSTFYVAISDADRHPALDYVATIHHGIDTGNFSFNPASGSYLAFFGRIHPDKGVVAAIDAAAGGNSTSDRRNHSG